MPLNLMIRSKKGCIPEFSFLGCMEVPFFGEVVIMIVIVIVMRRGENKVNS